MDAGWKSALQFSRNAIDAYMKTLLVDKVTTDDEKPAPPYLLDELSRILRTSSFDLIQEIVEYTFRRLRHKSPLVKRKVLRFIKYTVARAGPEYKKELQHRGALIRELFTFKGALDPIRGNAMSRAVQDAAHEAFDTIFSVDNNTSTCESVRGRIEGFGSEDFHPPKFDTKSSFSQEDSIGVIDDREVNSSDVVYKQGGQCENVGITYKLSDLKDCNHKDIASQNSNVDSLDDMLMENNLTSPTPPALHSFILNAQKFDATKLVQALKLELQSPTWQVRLNAADVLESILHQNDHNIVQTLQAEEMSLRRSLRECLASSQARLREKAKQVLDLLSALKNNLSEERSSPFFTLDVEDRLPHHIVGKDTVVDDPFHGMCVLDPSASALVDIDVLGDATKVQHIEEPFINLDIESTTHGQFNVSDFTMKYSCSGTRGSLHTNHSPGCIEGFHAGDNSSRKLLNFHVKGFGSNSISAGLRKHEASFDFISEHLQTNWGFKTVT